MNCPKCHSELRPGAKFCTKCGQKIEMGTSCPQCSATLKPGAKFCTKCGYSLASSSASVMKIESEVVRADNHQMPSDMSEAKGRMYWNVQPGQVARVIPEAEFENYNQIHGVIVPEGTTAYIRANGRTIASISGGSYEFVKVEDTMFRKGWKMVLGLFAGHKKKQENSSEQELLYMHQQQVILENAKQGAAFSVVILLDKAFPLMIGAKRGNTDDYKEFLPMKVKTRYYDLDMGVNAYFRISEPERFIVHYLTERQMVNSALIVDEITDSVRLALQDVLYDVELSSTHIPNELNQVLKDRVNAIAAESFFGLSVYRIVEVSAASDDLDRFAKLSREMYLSDKELEYLRRTNDFKNRLTDAVNEQELYQAATELEIKRKLNEINRNKRNEELLNEDELKKFEHLLVNERILREARTEQERNLALMEIAKTGLVREEELHVLQHQLKTQSYQRGMALTMMQLRDGIELERVRMEGKMEMAEMTVRKELELQGLRDDYADKRFYSELDKQKAVENAQLDLEQRKRDMDYHEVKRVRDMDREDDAEQFRQFMAIAELEQRGKAQEREDEFRREERRLKSAEDLERIKWEGAQHVSEEKVWALQGGDAAVAYAQNKHNAEKYEEMERVRREERARMDADRALYDAERREDKREMYQMMRDMMAMAGGAQAQREADRDRRYQEQMDEKDRQLRERDDRIRRQEGRMDTAYDRALDYTTRGNVAPQYSQQPQYPSQPYAPQSQPPVVKGGANCPRCGEPMEDDPFFCGNCGLKLNS